MRSAVPGTDPLIHRLDAAWCLSRGRLGAHLQVMPSLDAGDHVRERPAESTPASDDLELAEAGGLPCSSRGVVDDISHEGPRLLLREEGVSLPAVKTSKTSTDPDYAAKENRVLELYAIAEGKAEPGPGDPTVAMPSWSMST